MNGLKNTVAIEKMATAGSFLSDIFDHLAEFISVGMSTADIDKVVSDQLRKFGMISATKGYKGYRHVSCISVNDVVVHGIPTEALQIKEGDIISVDICASWNDYCADAARIYSLGSINDVAKKLIAVACEALNVGIEKACVGNRLGDISAAIQSVVEKNGFGVIRDFSGHGIGKKMHEWPDVPNYGIPGTGPLLQEGMTLAIEPMITAGSYRVRIDLDGWTVRTADRHLSAHVEDTIAILKSGPRILTRNDRALAYEVASL